MEIGLGEALAIVGLLLVGAAAISGYSQRSFVSVAVIAVGAGLLLAVTGVFAVEPGAHAVVVVVELVLLLTLFSDGLIVENELLRRHLGPAVRSLVIAMPLNAALLALAAKALFADLTWVEAFVLGFVLSPTDPVITSSIVASERVPRRVRHALNLESGLNDGLALPFVLFFLALTGPDPQGSVAGNAGDLAVESLIGAAVGVALAAGAGKLLGALPAWALTRRYEGLYALGLGLAAFGIADLLGGNGLIAAFVAGLSLGVVRAEMPEVFKELNENVSNVLQLVAFLVFGALVVETGWQAGSVVGLIAFIAFALLVARPASVLVAFQGTGLRRPEKLFIAWFGPKGIASMLFALFVLNSAAPDRTLVFEIAAFTILASIVAHGLTETPGARWIERRAGEEQERE